MQSGQNEGQRNLPIYNSLDLGEEHYNHFWEWTRYWEKAGLEYVNNEVLFYGVQMPYWSLELLTQMMFK